MTVTDFPIDSSKSNVSKIILEGRYPENGYAINLESEMVVYILEGSVELSQNATVTRYEAGDVVLVKQNSEYYWQPHNKISLLIVSTPPWTHEQQKII